MQELGGFFKTDPETKKSQDSNPIIFIFLELNLFGRDIEIGGRLIQN
jgi:hypothetical protein